MDQGFPGENESDEQVQQSSLISFGTTELHSDATTNQRLRRWQGKLHKLVKEETRLCQKDHQLERASPTESSNARWDSWLVRSQH